MIFPPKSSTPISLFLPHTPEGEKKEETFIPVLMSWPILTLPITFKENHSTTHTGGTASSPSSEGPRGTLVCPKTALVSFSQCLFQFFLLSSNLFPLGKYSYLLFLIEDGMHLRRTLLWLPATEITNIPASTLNLLLPPSSWKEGTPLLPETSPNFWLWVSLLPVSGISSLTYLFSIPPGSFSSDFFSVKQNNLPTTHILSS